MTVTFGELLGFFGLSVVGLTLIAIFLGKTLIKLVTAKDLEKFKTELEMRAFERQIVFSKLHEKRGFVIAELYSKIIRASLAIKNYIAASQPAGASSEEERGKESFDSFNEFRKYYLENEIYFDEEICDKINKFLIDNGEIITKFMIRSLLDGGEKINTWVEVENKFDNEIIPLTGDLAKAFRKILGVK